MNRKILERRKALLRAHQESGLAVEKVRKIAAEHNVSEAAIWKDWQRRATWLPKLMQLDEAKLHLLEMLHELKAVRESAWKLYREAESENAKVGALHRISDTIFKQTTLFQSLGLLEREPIRVEVLQTWRIAFEKVVEYMLRTHPESVDRIEGIVSDVEVNLDKYR